MSVPLGRSTAGVYVVVAALYLLAFPYHPRLRSPNELCRLWQTRALVDHGTLSINQTLREHGYVGDLSVKDGRYYPSKAPLLSFAAVPVYAALKALRGGPVTELPLVYFSRLFLTVLPTLGMLVLLRRFLASHLAAALADVLTVTYALGSLAFSYSLLFMSHQTTAVLLFTGFYALWRVGRGEWGRTGHVVAGACAGATVAAEYTGALGVLGLALYGTLAVLAGPREERARRLAQGFGLAVLGALPFVAALMLYHQAAFGHPLASGYQYLNDRAYQPWHLGGFLGIRYPDPRALALSFFSPLRGLFMLSPFLLLGVAGLGMRKAQDERAIFVSSAVLLAGYTYFTAAFSYDSWGWTTGPRHLTGLVPFLMLPAGRALERFRWGVGLCVASVALTGLATLVNYIPDDVSNAVVGLALPLLQRGYFPATVATFLGLPNAVGGCLLLVGLAAALAWMALTLRAGGRAVLACGLVVALHVLSFQHHRADEGARTFLESQWLVPPGTRLDFWASRLRE